MPWRSSKQPDLAPTAAEPPRCAGCGDIIGVYEPLVHVTGGLTWRTSRAAEPTVANAGGMLYHPGCYEPVAGTSGSAAP
jgi:hypothetical protein